MRSRNQKQEKEREADQIGRDITLFLRGISSVNESTTAALVTFMEAVSLAQYALKRWIKIFGDKGIDEVER